MTTRTPETAEEWRRMALAMKAQAENWQRQYQAGRAQYERAISMLRHLDPEAAKVAAEYAEGQNSITYVPVHIRDERDELREALRKSREEVDALRSGAGIDSAPREGARGEKFWAVPVDATDETDSLECVRFEDYQEIWHALVAATDDHRTEEDRMRVARKALGLDPT